MRYPRTLAALLILAVCGSGAPAQVLVPWDPLYGPLPPAGGVSFAVSRHHHHLSFYLSGGYAGPGYYYGPVGRSITVLSVYGPPPPPLVAAPLLLPPPDEPPVEVEVHRRIPPILPPAPDEPLPGEVAGNFRPLAPDNRVRARQPVLPDAPPPPAERPRPAPADQPRAPAPAPRQDEPKPKEAEHRPAELPPAPLPEADPRAEYTRLVALGKAALAAAEYGRAAQRFRQAATVLPAESEGHFLLGQTLFALGKYTDAVEAIHRGLALQPNWPSSHFRPLELYGDNVADYAQHLAWLQDAVVQHPDDPVLLFLYAYQLWFDGRQDEAVPLFQRATRLASDKGDSERFLQARQPELPTVFERVDLPSCCC